MPFAASNSVIPAKAGIQASRATGAMLGWMPTFAGMTKASRARCLTVLAAPSFLAASGPQLQPGLWEVVNRPGVATLDGQALDDLPLGAPKTQRICLAAKEAADPARFFARDTAADCRITKSNLAGGAVAISGACPNPEEGNEGSVELTGSFDAGSYDIDFATRAEDFQGVMTFSGKLSGRRVGECPA